MMSNAMDKQFHTIGAPIKKIFNQLWKRNFQKTINLLHYKKQAKY